MELILPVPPAPQSSEQAPHLGMRLIPPPRETRSGPPLRERLGNFVGGLTTNKFVERLKDAPRFALEGIKRAELPLTFFTAAGARFLVSQFLNTDMATVDQYFKVAAAVSTIGSIGYLALEKRFGFEEQHPRISKLMKSVAAHAVLASAGWFGEAGAEGFVQGNSQEASQAITTTPTETPVPEPTGTPTPQEDQVVAPVSTETPIPSPTPTETTQPTQTAMPTETPPPPTAAVTAPPPAAASEPAPFPIQAVPPEQPESTVPQPQIAEPPTSIEPTISPTSKEVAGSVADGTLTYDGKSWDLINNGEKNIDNLLRVTEQAGTVDRQILADNLQKATELWTNGQLDKSTDPDLWKVFNLSNGTQSVFPDLLNVDTLESLKKLGIVR